MRALGSDGKPKSERTAGQSTSVSRDVAGDASSVDREEKKAIRTVGSVPEPSDGEESDSGVELSQTPLERRKKQIVDNVMAIVMQWLDKTFPPKQHCHGDNSSTRTRGASAGGGRSAKGSGGDGDDNKENKVPQRPRKRQQRDETPEDNGDGDGKRGGKGSKRAKKDAEGRRFACPFHKHDPLKYKHSRACRLPGFITLHRLKEHIYRTHLNSLVCPRCGDKFSTEQARDIHLRADDMCKKRDFGPLDGINKEQEKKIRARPKKDTSTDEQKWISIYKIIFPDTPEDSIPSPYCDDQQSQSLDGMHAYIRRGLPHAVRRQLEEYIERSTNDTEKKATDTILRLLPDLTGKLIEMYRRENDQPDDETLAPVAFDTAVANDPQSPVLDNSIFFGVDQPAYEQLLVDHNLFSDTNLAEFGLGSTSGPLSSSWY